MLLPPHCNREVSFIDCLRPYAWVIFVLKKLSQLGYFSLCRAQTDVSCEQEVDFHSVF